MEGCRGEVKHAERIFTRNSAVDQRAYVDGLLFVTRRSNPRALHALSAYHATIADIRQGTIDYESGAGQPLSEATADIRRELGAKP
jgi:hypothetical protein